MSERVLLVDDDPLVLQAYRRQLRKRYDLDIAQGPEEGLAAIDAGEPYAVIVSDMRMPGMDGVQFLTEARRRAPQSVRIMLTGQADQQTAASAVNEGHIFQFLSKPCSPESFITALESGVSQYRLYRAERELLSKTLTGSVKVLTDVLSLANPAAFGRCSRVRRLVRQLCNELEVENAWECEIAAMLSQVGCVAVPQQTLGKVLKNEPLSEAERQSYSSHPKVGHDLIANIPRLAGAADMVALQEKQFDGKGFPKKIIAGEDLPLGARILKLSLDYDAATAQGQEIVDALAVIKGRDGWYDPRVVAALENVLDVEATHVIVSVELDDLTDNAILAEDVITTDGTLLIGKGQEVSPSLRIRLINHAQTVGIESPIKIIVAGDSLTKNEPVEAK